MKIHDFRQSIEVGKKGEEEIISLLENGGYKVEDVRDIKYFQERDIDFILTDTTKSFNTTYGIEVKTDTYTTSGNMFFETMSNVEAHVPGCMWKTKSDYLFYYFLGLGELYVLPVKELRDWFKENRKNFSKKVIKNRRKFGDSFYTSEGYTIKKTFLEESFKECKKIVIGRKDEKVG